LQLKITIEIFWVFSSTGRTIIVQVLNGGVGGLNYTTTVISFDCTKN